MLHPQRLYHHFMLLCTALFWVTLCSAQKQKDSLEALVRITAYDTAKVDILHRLYQVTDSVSYARTALQLAKKTEYKRGMAFAYLDIGRTSYFAGRPVEALDYLVRCIKIAEPLKLKKVLIPAYRYIGYIYRPDDPFIAEDYYKKSMKLARELNDSLSVSYALSGLGNIYEMIFDVTNESNKKALQYYLESLAIREKLGAQDEIASSLNETSRIYDVLGFHEKSLELRLKGLDIAEKSRSTENIVFLANVVGNEYARLHDYKRSLQYHLLANTFAAYQKNNLEAAYDISKGLGYDYDHLGDKEKANIYFQQAISLIDSIKSSATKHDYNLSGLKHDMEQELEKEKLLVKDARIAEDEARAKQQAILRDASLVVLAFILILAILLYRGYKRNQKSNLELASKNEKIEEAYKVLAESEQKFKLITETINDVFYLFNIQEKRYEYISPNCETLFGLSQQWIYEKNTTKSVVHKRDLQLVIDANIRVDSGTPYDIEYRVEVNDQVKWIHEKSSPIYDEKGNLVRNSGICRDITRRKINEQIIESKNQDIRDSILYARNIQNAILVPKKEMEKELKDFFVLSKPKDIVSGDFYFYRKTENGLIVAVADCTGHGVPGGFMSMLGSAFLNEIISNDKAINAAQILDRLAGKIIVALNQKVDYHSNKDGMDIALLYFNPDFTSVQYAGAFNSLYMIRNGELEEVMADKRPVGINIALEQKDFTNNKIDLRKGDCLYIFSDGYIDQFGGPQIKKFAKKQMRDTLLAICDKKMEEQEKLMDKTFEDWKGEQLQIDDVMLMGIRV